jgi:hypothetical protein
MVLPRDNLREAVDFLMHFLGSFIVGYSFPIFPKVESERVRRDRHGARGCWLARLESVMACCGC